MNKMIVAMWMMVLIPMTMLLIVQLLDGGISNKVVINVLMGIKRMFINTVYPTVREYRIEMGIYCVAMSFITALTLILPYLI